MFTGYYLSLPLEYKFHESRDFCLFCSLMYHQCLECVCHILKHGKCSLNTCWMDAYSTALQQKNDFSISYVCMSQAVTESTSKPQHAQVVCWLGEKWRFSIQYPRSQGQKMNEASTTVPGRGQSSGHTSSQSLFLKLEVCFR